MLRKICQCPCSLRDAISRQRWNQINLCQLNWALCKHINDKNLVLFDREVLRWLDSVRESNCVSSVIFLNAFVQSTLFCLYKRLKWQGKGFYCAKRRKSRNLWVSLVLQGYIRMCTVYDPRSSISGWRLNIVVCVIATLCLPHNCDITTATGLHCTKLVKILISTDLHNHSYKDLIWFLALMQTRND